MYFKTCVVSVQVSHENFGHYNLFLPWMAKSQYSLPLNLSLSLREKGGRKQKGWTNAPSSINTTAIFLDRSAVEHKPCQRWAPDSSHFHEGALSPQASPPLGRSTESPGLSPPWAEHLVPRPLPPLGGALSPQGLIKDNIIKLTLSLSFCHLPFVFCCRSLTVF